MKFHEHFLKKNDDLIKLYSDLPEALENNYNFHLRFCYKPKKSKPILPSVAHNKSNSPEEELAKQAKKGLQNRIDNFCNKYNIFFINTSSKNKNINNLLDLIFIDYNTYIKPYKVLQQNNYVKLNNYI